MRQLFGYMMVALCALILMLAYDVSAQRGPGEFWGGQFSQPLRGAAGLISFPTYSFSGDPDTGIYNSSANRLAFAAGGNIEMELITNALRFASDQTISWSSTTAASGTQDTSLARSAADTLTLGANDNLLLPVQASASGERYVCITTTGQLTSQAAACVGT